MQNSDKDITLLLVRIMTGVVFLSEGIQKFIYPEILGVGRFEKIGIRFPEFTANFVGGTEIMCAVFIIIGLFSKYVTIPLILIIIFALETTKFDIFRHEGFWKFMHESRTDWSMFIGIIIIMMTGSGKFSLEYILTNYLKKKKKN
jgi:putative oxidoreductase